jgi:hypothetical protein
MKTTMTSLLTAFAAVLVLLALPPAAQAQHSHGLPSDCACHYGMSR